ncbi:MAG: YlmC/YmxH family sporulation protein [Oscillospiraceae bacterium]|nr:YlmC/YmxH family sporulation protein [Oscillospiraceae bacterium]
MVECLSEIRCKEVINVMDGCRLGYADNFEIDLQDGRLVSLLIPGPCRFFGLFGRDSDYVIPWPAIRKIGMDIILVEVVPEKCKRPRVRKGFFQ